MLWVIFGIAVLVFIIFAISFYTFYICFYSPADRTEDPYAVMRGSQYAAVRDDIVRCTRIMDKTECEWVQTASFDGLKLAARYYHTADNAPLMILFHGYRSISLRDCAGGFLLGRKMGFNVLVADQRAHASSEGRVITFGIKERKDCLSWVEYAINRFGSDVKIVLSGLSMGAATVLMASELNLQDNVVCIVADCPYSSPADIIRKVCRDRHLPDNLAYPFIRLGARIYGNFDLEETTAANAVEHAKIPVLLLHGEDDRFVPCEMSMQIRNACAGPVQLETFPSAGHGLCYMTDPLRYESKTVRFLYQIQELRPYMYQSEYIRKVLEDHG